MRGRGHTSHRLRNEAVLREELVDLLAERRGEPRGHCPLCLRRCAVVASANVASALVPSAAARAPRGFTGRGNASANSRGGVSANVASALVPSAAAARAAARARGHLHERERGEKG